MLLLFIQNAVTQTRKSRDLDLKDQEGDKSLELSYLIPVPSLTFLELTLCVPREE